MAGVEISPELGEHRDVLQRSEAKQIGAQSIIDIVSVIGDVVGNGGSLRFGAGLAPQHEVVGGSKLVNRGGKVSPEGISVAVGQRAIVLDDTFQGFPSEIETIKLRITSFDPCDDTQCLGVVIEPTKRLQTAIERALAGMAERRVPEVVGERQGLGEILVKAERASKRAGDLGDFKGVSEPGAVMITLVKHEDLGLVLEPTEGRRVDDAIAIAAKQVARRTGRFRMDPAARGAWIGRIGGALATAIDSHDGLMVRELTRAEVALNYHFRGRAMAAAVQVWAAAGEER